MNARHLICATLTLAALLAAAMTAGAIAALAHGADLDACVEGGAV